MLIARTYTGTNPYQWRQRSLRMVQASVPDMNHSPFSPHAQFPKVAYLVERCGSLVPEDLGSTIQSARILRARLQANFDNICSTSLVFAQPAAYGPAYRTVALQDC